MNISDSQPIWVKAARKIRQASANDGGLEHSMFCNYRSEDGNGHGRCNCGISDILTALKEYEKI